MWMQNQTHSSKLYSELKISKNFDDSNQEDMYVGEQKL